jgi:L-malate glycosyltransferase
MGSGTMTEPFSRPPTRRSRGPASVVHVLWSMDIGGAQRALYQLIREQRRRGRRADLVVVNTAGFYGEQTRKDGADVYELGARSALDFRAGRRLARLVSVYDIVHFHAVEPVLIHAAARLTKQRLFYTHRAGLFSYPLKQRLRYKLASRDLRRSFDAVAGNTAQAARAAAKLFGIPEERIPVVYNGIDFSLLASEDSRERLLRKLGLGSESVVRIGTSANLRDCKRVELLLHAIAELDDRGVQCVIIGDGPERLPLEQLSRTLNVADRVVFVGKQQRVGDYLKVLDVFTLPSGPEESFGNAAVEAMGCGVPTVVFRDGGGLTEHVLDGQTGFVARDQAQYVQRLRELVDSEATRRKIGAAGMQFVRKKYATEAMVAGYDHLYDAASPSPQVTTCAG